MTTLATTPTIPAAISVLLSAVNVPLNELRGRSQADDVQEARRLAVWLLAEHHGWDTAAIASFLDRHPGQVRRLHGRARYDIRTDPVTSRFAYEVRWAAGEAIR